MVLILGSMFALSHHPAGQSPRGWMKLLDVWLRARGQAAAEVHTRLSTRFVVKLRNCATADKKKPPGTKKCAGGRVGDLAYGQGHAKTVV